LVEAEVGGCKGGQKGAVIICGKASRHVGIGCGQGQVVDAACR